MWDGGVDGVVAYLLHLPPHVVGSGESGPSPLWPVAVLCLGLRGELAPDVGSDTWRWRTSTAVLEATLCSVTIYRTDRERLIAACCV